MARRRASRFDRLLGKRVKTMREFRGMSQRDLCKILRRAPSYVTRMEQGQRSWSLELIVKVAAALDLPPTLLLATVFEEAR